MFTRRRILKVLGAVADGRLDSPTEEKSAILYGRSPDLLLKWSMATPTITPTTEPRTVRILIVDDQPVILKMVRSPAPAACENPDRNGPTLNASGFPL
jgi:hypothetical protein